MMVRAHAFILLGIIMGIFAERAEHADEVVFIACALLLFWTCAHWFKRLEDR